MIPATARDRPWQPPGPGRPGAPPAAPAAELPAWLAERLYQRRIVFLRGTITPESASTAAATLLALDSPAGDPVQLHLDCPDGDLDAVLALLDAVDGLQVPLHALATGQVGGAAIGAYAVATRRLAFPHARFRLAEPRVAGIVGTADDVTSAAGRHLRALEDLLIRVAEATGQPRSRVEDDFSTGRLLDAAAARDYGLVHEVQRPRGAG